MSQRYFQATIQETGPSVTPDVMKYYHRLAGELQRKTSREIERMDMLRKYGPLRSPSLWILPSLSFQVLSHRQDEG